MNGDTLIMKTADDRVMFKILDNYADRRDVYCFIQPSGFEFFSSRYPKIQFYNIGRESFDYTDDVIINCVGTKKFNTVILPSSKVLFQGFSGVFGILEHIKYDTLVFINVDGEVRTVKKSAAKDWLYKVLVKSFSIYIGFQKK